MLSATDHEKTACSAQQHDFCLIANLVVQSLGISAEVLHNMRHMWQKLWV